MKHENNCSCCRCCNPELADAKEKLSLKEYGWFAHYVTDDDSYPYGVNYHTHGIKENFNHSDFQIVFPIDPEVSHMILFNLINKIGHEKKTFEADKKYSKISGNDYLLTFIEVKEGNRKVLRLIVPGKDGELD